MKTEEKEASMLSSNGIVQSQLNSSFFRIAKNLIREERWTLAEEQLTKNFEALRSQNLEQNLTSKALRLRAKCKNAQYRVNDALADIDLLLSLIEDDIERKRAETLKNQLILELSSENQARKLTELVKYEAEDHPLRFVVSARWFQQWQVYSGFDCQKFPLKAERKNIRPGEIDNSDLIDFQQSTMLYSDGKSNSYKLHPNIKEDSDYVILSAHAFKYLQGIYGCNYELPRKLVEAKDGTFFVEVHLVSLRVIVACPQPTLKMIQVSRTIPVEEVVQNIMILEGLPKTCRVWVVSMNNISLERLVVTVAKQEVSYFNAQLLTDTHLKLGEVDIELVWVFEQEPFVLTNNKEVSANRCSFCQNHGKLQVSCKKCDLSYCSRLCKNRDSLSHKQICKSSKFQWSCFFHFRRLTRVREENQLTAIHIIPTPHSRKGLVGLKNLGNTCYMNAVLQCLSNSPALRNYFLTRAYEHDLNKKASGGLHGELAYAFGELLENLWHGHNKKFNPKTLKKALCKISAQFIGREQHDSHEFMCCLLDGLNEDLNRVTVRAAFSPSKEVDETDDYSKLALQSWEKLLSSTSSSIVDLMYGQFRSTIHCTDCEHSAYSFEPFLTLSLPLPVEEFQYLNFYLIWDSCNKLPLQITLRLSITSDLSAIKEYLHSEFKILSAVFARVSKNEVMEFYSESSPLKLDNSSMLFAYEAAANPDFLIEIHMLSSLAVLQGFPRVISLQSHDTFQTLHLEIYRKVRYLLHGLGKPRNLEKEFQKSFQRLDYTLQFKATDSVACQLCNCSSCQGCAVPYSTQQISSQLRSHHIRLELTLAKRKYFTNINKCLNYRLRQKPPPIEEVDLLDCFKLLETAEEIDSEHGWYCKQCKSNVQATKKLEIYKAPNVLILHLKRFRSSLYFREKLLTLVKFPETALSIDRFVIGPDKPLEYELCGVVNHFGNLGMGHYTATCKNTESSQWFDFNDDSVQASSGFLPQQAYLLFYIAKA